MDAPQIKDEIRKLNRIDKNEIYRWIDEEASIGPLFWIGVPGNRIGEQGAGPKKRVHLSPAP